MFERIILAVIITIIVLIIIKFASTYIKEHTIDIVLALGLAINLSDWILRVYKKDLVLEKKIE